MEDVQRSEGHDPAILFGHDHPDGRLPAHPSKPSVQGLGVGWVAQFRQQAQDRRTVALPHLADGRRSHDHP